MLGLPEGLNDDDIDGLALGDLDGLIDGLVLGDGDIEGLNDGDLLGDIEGESDGESDGLKEGDLLGDKDDEREGLAELDHTVIPSLRIARISRSAVSTSSFQLIIEAYYNEVDLFNYYIPALRSLSANAPLLPCCTAVTKASWSL